MPRPTRQQSAFVALCLVDGLHRVAVEAAKLRDDLARVIVEEGQLNAEELDRLITAHDELRERVELFGHSARALELARRSIT